MERRAAHVTMERKEETSIARLLGFGMEASAVPESFLRENRRLLLSRTRILILFASGLLLLSLPVDYFRVPIDRYPQAVAIRLVGCAVLLSFVPVLSWSSAERWAEWLAGAVFLVLGTITLSMAPLFAEGASDPGYATQIIGTIFLVMGSGLLLPFNGRTMALLGGILLLLHIALTMDFALAQNLPALFATFAAVAAATIGAQQLFEGRLSEYRDRLTQAGLITAKEEVVRAQETLIRARADFVAMLTHDMKNPLSAVLGFTELLRECLREGGDPQDAVDGIESATRQAMALAVNFLDVDRIERGVLELRRKPTSLNGVVEHVIQYQRPRSRLTHHVLRPDFCAEIPLLDLDEALVERAVANLVSNAIKFSPEGAEVIIATRLRDQRAVVEVRDCGPGIALEDQSRLFDRYSPGSRSRVDSTGLGLFINKSSLARATQLT